MTEPPSGWRLRTRTLGVSDVAVMGVVNVTPDSFSDGGRYLDREAAIDHARRLLDAGADLVDVGGESTRPGAEPVEPEEEQRRVLPVVEALASEGAVVSVDTSKPEVAEAAVAAGAEVINDVTGLGDPAMRRLAADSGVGVVVMHMQGTPRTMQIDPTYVDVVADVRRFLSDRAELAVSDGVSPDRICVDPGIGFGKDLHHNLTLLDRLAAFCELGYPVMIGTSRKRFLGEIAGVERPEDRDLASAVTVAWAVERGARVVRMHEVSGARQAARLGLAMVGARARP